jgi:hypothetical protein
LVSEVLRGDDLRTWDKTVDLAQSSETMSSFASSSATP